jgi:hypothetical protein
MPNNYEKAVEKVKTFLQRSQSPTKAQRRIKGPVTAVAAAGGVGLIGKAVKGPSGKKPIRTAIKKVKDKIQANKDFKAQQKSVKAATPTAAKFNRKEGSKVPKPTRN